MKTSKKSKRASLPYWHFQEKWRVGGLLVEGFTKIWIKYLLFIFFGKLIFLKMKGKEEDDAGWKFNTHPKHPPYVIKALPEFSLLCNYVCILLSAVFKSFYFWVDTFSRDKLWCNIFKLDFSTSSLSPNIFFHGM